MSNLNFPNSRIYSGHYMPVLVDFNFVVDSANSNGYGCSSITGAYVKQVYMHSSYGTPAAINPIAGLILVQLKTNFNKLLYSTVSELYSPLTGSDIAVNGSSLTVGRAYTISSVGTTTTAQWVVAGVPIGVTPAVGVSFIAIATGAGGGTGQVQLAATSGSGITRYDMIGNANLSIAPTGPGYSVSSKGSWFIFRALAATNASTTTLQVTAPADGTKIGIQLMLSNTSLTLGGQ